MPLSRVISAIVIATVLGAAPRVALAQSTVVELNEAGWKALNGGDPDRAARYFADALAIRPDDPVLLTGAAASANAQGRPYEAIVKLRAALQLRPSLTPASLLLGQLVYHDGDLDEAIRIYDAALALAPGNADLASALTKWTQEAATHAGFSERRQDRFRVQFDGRADEELASLATATLTDAFWRIGQVLGAYPSDPIVAILYTGTQFRDITRAPDWSGGIYDGRIRVPVAGANREPKLFAAVLTHELTHAIVANLAPRNVPVWLHEGLAQYFEGADVEAARRRVHERRSFVPLSSLEGSFTRLSAEQARLAYDESLVAVSAMMARPAFGWTRLFDVLGRQTFTQTIDGFGFSYADLEASFVE